MLGVDHFGKNLEAGSPAAPAKEAPCDLVLACLGDKRAQRQRHQHTAGGAQVPRRRAGPGISRSRLRVVEHPEPDEDGEPITTMVVDWQPAPPGGAQPQPARSLGTRPPAGSAYGGAAAEAGAHGHPG